MSRGLPYSIIVHLLTLALVVFFGNAVTRQEIKTPRSIRVRMVELPRAPEIQPETKLETPPEQVVPLSAGKPYFEYFEENACSTVNRKI